MKKLTADVLAKMIWQREIDDNEHDDEFVDILYEHEAEWILKLIHETLGQDAAYALGEEAFRAGFNAAVQLMENRQQGPLQWVRAEQSRAWFDYESSEDVKSLIDG